VGAARQAVAAAQSGRQVAVAQFLPRVYVLASVGRVAGESVLGGWQEGAGIHLDQPIFTGGAHRGELRAAEAEIQEATASAQAILDQISLEVALAWRSLEAARQRIELARPAVDEARENLRLVRVKYRNGNATPTDIVDAETTLTRAEQRLTSASFEYLAAAARLAYATGTEQAALLCAAEQTQELPRPEPESR
jgi:outer membrane protein TolC